MRKVLAAFVIISFLLPAPANALVEIIPASKNLSIFSNTYYNFNVTISGINNVYGFQFDLNYNPVVFESPVVTEGTFLNRNGQDSTYCLGPNISTSGLIDNYACSREGSGTVSGSGVLAKIRLTLKNIAVLPNKSSIILSGVKISDINSQPLDNSSKGGNVTVYYCLPGETRSCIKDGKTGTATCASNNQWGACQVPASPPSGGPGTLPSGNGEEPPSGYFYAADINMDGCVDIEDLAMIGVNFGMGSGFVQRTDINSDGRVDIKDLVLAGLAFMKGDDC